jgi:hypothetical protein
MKRYGWYALGGIVVVLIAIQFIPVARSNPPVESDIGAPAEIAAILRRSCYDCHSHETQWPGYSRIAPGSWLMARGVKEARGKLNFSTWNRYSGRDRSERIEEIWEQADEGEMPPRLYLLLHGDARLSEEDRQKLEVWSDRASRQARVGADVEDAARDLLEETERAIEEAAEALLKATERALKDAEDALKDGRERRPQGDESGEI